MANVKSENKSSRWDLKYLLDLVQTSFRKGNYEDALKAALFGLNEAVDQSQEEWRERFESMHSELKLVYDTEIKCKTSMNGQKIGEQFERENSLDGDDLAEVKGIEQRAAGLLTKAGITTVQQLADSSIEELSRIKGIGTLTAKKMLDSVSIFLNSGMETDFELKDAIRASENGAIVEQESLRIERPEEPELALEPFDDDPGCFQDVDEDAKNLES